MRRLAAVVPVTIVSGRDIDVVTALVGIDGLGFVGSHGLDITGPSGSGLRKEVARQFRTELDAVEAELRRRVGVIDGAVVERKRFSISTHMRLVGPDDRPARRGRGEPTSRRAIPRSGARAGRCSTSCGRTSNGIKAPQ